MSAVDSQCTPLSRYSRAMFFWDSILFHGVPLDHLCDADLARRLINSWRVVIVFVFVVGVEVARLFLDLAKVEVVGVEGRLVRVRRIRRAHQLEVRRDLESHFQLLVEFTRFLELVRDFRELATSESQNLLVQSLLPPPLLPILLLLHLFELLHLIVILKVPLKLFDKALLHLLVQRVCFAEVLREFSEVIAFLYADATGSGADK